MANAIILAAGKGKRMRSEQNKCLQLVLGKPILRHIVDHLKKAGIKRIVIVIGWQGKQIQAYFKDEVEYAWQHEQNGTGHAVMQAVMLKDSEEDTIVINGDVPLVKTKTFQELLVVKKQSDLVLLSTIMEDPQRYGRIVRDDKQRFIKVVETDDCNSEQQKIKEINGAIYCFDNKKLWEVLPMLEKNNKQGEYYLTDVIELFVDKGYKTLAKIVDDTLEIMGVDHRMGQAVAIKKLQSDINQRHMENGVFLVNPDETYIEDEVIIEADVTVYPNVYLQGKTTIKSETIIEAGSVINNSSIGKGVVIKNSQIYDSEIGDNSRVGPYAHLRNNCKIGSNCRIGNFVEMKKTVFGDGSKCAHLTYLGDCIVGKKVNIGCGVVAVNYDGIGKYETLIGDGAFVGSNCNLVAPIKIGKNALVAAGSTVDKDVPDGAMGIARTRQSNIEDIGDEYRKHGRNYKK